MMAYDERLIDWVRNGLHKGYSSEHIADVMRRHGYRDPDITTAFSYLGGHRKPRPWLIISIIACTLLIIAISIAVVVEQDRPNAAITGGVVGVESADDYRVYLDRIAYLQHESDEQQAALDAALERANDAELSAAEKDALLRQLQSYYDQVKKEREETKSALFDLWTFLFSKDVIE